MATPTEWLNEFQVNTGTAATGSQSDPQIIGLSNGNILVAWTENSTGAIATQNGQDIVGKIYDAEGNLVRDSYRLNSSSTNDDERDFDIAATNDGGFVLVYLEAGRSDGDGTNVSEINWQRFNSDGSSTNSAVIATANAAGDNLSNPQVSVSELTNRSYVTFTRNAGGQEDIRAVLLSATGSTDTAEFDAAQNSSDIDRNADSAILVDSNLVTVYQEDDAGTLGLEAQITNSAGVQQHLIQVTGAAIADPQVASLVNGGFVVTWVQGNDIRYRVYNSSAVAVSVELTAASGTNNQNEPEIIALPDGDFVIVWDDDSAGELYAQRFNADGSSNGSTFTVENVPTTSPSIGVTGDGRILFTWEEEAGELFASIWDPRTSTISAADYDLNLRNFVNSEVITSQITSSTVNGDSDSNKIFAFAGSDLLNGAGGNDTISGGAGNDTVQGGSGHDILNGGANHDRISGHAGNDTLIGAFGNDILSGGADDDTMNGGAGNDTLIGGGGGDKMLGSTGRDLASYALAPGSVVANLSSPAGNTGQAAGDTYASIEDLTGSPFDDTLTGNAGNNKIYGIGGADRIFGLSGNDTLNGGNSGDNLNGGGGNDRLNGQAGFDTLSGAVGADWLDGGGGNDTLNGGAGNDTLVGGTGNDWLFGANDADTINGGAGNDAVYGGGGNDKLIGSTGNDTITGGSGQDYMSGGPNADTFDFNSVSESPAGVNRDIIHDFATTIDTIDLQTIDANAFAAGNQAFGYIGAAAFTGVAGQLRFITAGGSGFLQGDVNGDGAADLAIQLNGVTSISIGDLDL